MGSFLLYIVPEFLIPFQKILILISMAGQYIIHQRFRTVYQQAVLVPPYFYIFKIWLQIFSAILQSKPFIQFIRRQGDSAVKVPHQFIDFFHMTAAVSTAQKSTAPAQNSVHFPADTVNILTVKQHMVGNDQIKRFVRKRNPVGIHILKAEPAVLTADLPPRIPEHSLRDVRNDDLHFTGKPIPVFRPEASAPASQLQHRHSIPQTALLKHPGKPTLWILGIQAVEPDPGGNIAGVLILALQTLFHTGQTDQLQHLAPVDLMSRLQRSRRVLNRPLHQLKLFNPVLHQFLLKLQRIEHIMPVHIIHRHLTDIVQGKSQILQQKNLLKPRKIRICIIADARLTDPGRFQDILLIIKPDRPHGNVCHSGEFSGGIVTILFHAWSPSSCFLAISYMAAAVICQDFTSFSTSAHSSG